MNFEDKCTPYIEIISLAHMPIQADCVTARALDIICEQKKQGKKTLLFYNRRGNAHAFLCADCGYFEKCPHCDIALCEHIYPQKRLLCHQCHKAFPYPAFCPHCQGHRFISLGVGIEAVGAELLQQLPKHTNIFLLDADHRDKKHDTLFSHIEAADVILATDMGTLLLHKDIGAVIFLLFEVNFSVPVYTLEEELYANIAYIKKQNIPLYIQTHIPKHPFLQEVVFGNYKSFLQTLQAERKKFCYPPYADFAILQIRNRKKETILGIVATLKEKIAALSHKDTIVSYHSPDYFEKIRGEWSQKIILKGRSVADSIEVLRPYIVSNRSLSLQWYS